MGNAVCKQHFMDSKAQGHKVVKYSTNSRKASKHEEILVIVDTNKSVFL